MILIDDRNAGQPAGEYARASRDDRAGAVSTMRALGRARSQQALVAVVVVLSLAVWFSATAVVPTIQVQWGITVTEAVWLTAAVQIGFVLGAVVSAFTNLADRIAPHVLLGASAAGAAIVTAILALFVDSLAVAIPLRLVTGMFMAGVYPLGMKLMVSWSTTERRGSSLGLLIGALTLGSALPHLIGVLPIDWRWLMFASAMTTLAGAVIALAFIRPGPQLDSHRSKPNARYVISMFRDPRQRLINLGYFGHMWELYAMWAWLPTFVIASHSVHSTVTSGEASLIVFLSIGVAGVAGCLLGGWLSDRFGRSRTAALALLISGLCCMASPAAFLFPGVVLVVFAVIWGASVIADSGIFSTLLADAADPRYVGTALTAQTAIGFLVTVITIQLTPVMAGWVGWQFAFLSLGVGPIVGVLAMKFFGQHNTTSKETTV